MEWCCQAPVSGNCRNVFTSSAMSLIVFSSPPCSPISSNSGTLLNMDSAVVLPVRPPAARTNSQLVAHRSQG
eukprot:7439602-Pyramimonas_sp.AAC.1